MVETSTEVARATSGCTGLDLALGGGYGIGRITSIAGLKSTGKTQLAIETCAHFKNDYPKAKIYYVDAETAFDLSFAQFIGFPKEDVTLVRHHTVEDFERETIAWINNLKGPKPAKGKEPAEEGDYAIVVLDSLDALGTKKEIETTVEDAAGFANARKAAIVSSIYKKLLTATDGKNVAVVIIHQLRVNVSGYGALHLIAGGKAVELFGCAIVRDSKLKTLTKTIKGNVRATGVRVKAYVEKNKLGLPFREFEFTIQFHYGIDDIEASLSFLQDQGELARLPRELVMTVDKDNKEKLVEKVSTVIDRLEKLDDLAFAENLKLLKKTTTDVWNEIEAGFTVTRRRKF